MIACNKVLETASGLDITNLLAEIFPAKTFYLALYELDAALKEELP